MKNVVDFFFFVVLEECDRFHMLLTGQVHVALYYCQQLECCAILFFLFEYKQRMLLHLCLGFFLFFSFLAFLEDSQLGLSMSRVSPGFGPTHTQPDWVGSLKN